MEPYFGRVTYFNTPKLFGFIKPQQPRRDGKDVFFHLNSHAPLSEEFPGQLGLNIDQIGEAPRFPCAGELMTYEVAEDPRGPRAYVWGFGDDYAAATRIIRDRPRPMWTRCRVMSYIYSQVSTPRGDQWYPLKKSVFWEGFSPQLVNMVREGKSPISFPEHGVEESWWFEELHATGEWVRMWDPRDTSFPRHVFTAEEIAEVEAFTRKRTRQQ